MSKRFFSEFLIRPAWRSALFGAVATNCKELQTGAIDIGIPRPTLVVRGSHHTQAQVF